jgi:hypothetical protein
MDFIIFERNTPFKFSNAAHMNTQIIGIPQSSQNQFQLEDRAWKLVQKANFLFERHEQGGYKAFKAYYEEHKEVAPFFFYLELPGMKTAKGTQ